MPPVSVCHHVSTKGHLFLTIFELYKSQASKFIGSPTEPITFNEFRLDFSKYLSPKDCKALISVVGYPH